MPFCHKNGCSVVSYNIVKQGLFGTKMNALFPNKQILKDPFFKISPSSLSSARTQTSEQKKKLNHLFGLICRFVQSCICDFSVVDSCTLRLNYLFHSIFTSQKGGWGGTSIFWGFHHQWNVQHPLHQSGHWGASGWKGMTKDLECWLMILIWLLNNHLKILFWAMILEIQTMQCLKTVFLLHWLWKSHGIFWMGNKSACLGKTVFGRQLFQTNLLWVCSQSSKDLTRSMFSKKLHHHQPVPWVQVQLVGTTLVIIGLLQSQIQMFRHGRNNMKLARKLHWNVGLMSLMVCNEDIQSLFNFRGWKTRLANWGC